MTGHDLQLSGIVDLARAKFLELFQDRGGVIVCHHLVWPSGTSVSIRPLPEVQIVPTSK
jgi:hypothetical protein